MENSTPKSSKKNWIIAGVVATSLLVGGAAVAGGKGCGGDREGHRGKWSMEQSAERSQKRLDRLASKLELSDEQKTQVETIMQANRAQRMQQAQTNREALKTELGSVLSAEQMEEFETMMDKRGGKGEKRQKRMQKNAES